MALRSFTDPHGRQWEVWDVIPHGVEADERRRIERRGERGTESAFDRRQADRRASLSPQMAEGWLAFRCGEERRRLAPIPAGWSSASDTQLDEYCRIAHLVGTAPMHFIARAPGEPSTT